LSVERDHAAEQRLAVAEAAAWAEAEDEVVEDGERIVGWDEDEEP
jgi:hypothetical protein